MKKITIRDVAREAGVSVTLVSFVMNAKADKDGRLDCPVNADTAKRVLQVAKRLGYRKNAAAASLRSGRTNTIAVIPTDISNKFFAGISRYIEDKAHSFGYNVLFASSDESAEKLDAIMNTMMAYSIDGVIVAPCKDSYEVISKIVESNVPVVLLDRDLAQMSESEVGKVLLNDREAGYMASNSFLDKGLTRVEMISYNLGISSLAERENGYKKAMSDRGLDMNIRVHYTSYGPDAINDVTDIVTDAVKRGVEAFFLPTYSLSSLVLSVMREQGLKTPKDLAIVGFDESDIYNLYDNTVTHIVQPLRELAERSVDVLHSMIEKTGGERTFILNPEIILGGSTEDIVRK
ncbi:MAG: LacI family DNA-binding transcriptional regulator [Candidatus Cryptobacteroides sp.]